MNAPYHSKALPEGAVLREWKLEQVLGVGGFGIVYRARGVYFDELVAIKEYFPGAISDRMDGVTVTPTDSSSEEIYTLGLSKFVEEAKILWNLSKPERHPNIVCVRSLFEINGTAYIVMDFESGVSLSQMLRDGRRFDEASLMALIRPIAEGLDRAHRAGVVHRDIKPANILVNDAGRPVLIDFGSARFDSGQATSTKVTFYTPPYAAIEQYVKTYPQGPWTDIYALGVALYQCVTGEKPPEVLERLHGGLGEPLSARERPGFSPAFTRAVDAAMAIRPTERPQSIAEWLKLFDEPAPAAEDDATRIAPLAAALPEPVAVPPPLAPEPVTGPSLAFEDATVATTRPLPPSPPAAEQTLAAATVFSPSKPARSRTPWLIAAGAVGAVALTVGLATVVQHMKAPPAPVAAPTPPPPKAVTAAPQPGGGPPALAKAVGDLADDAQKFGRPEAEIRALTAAKAKATAIAAQIQPLAATPAKAAPLAAQLNAEAASTARAEASALGRTAQGEWREAQRTLAGAVGAADTLAAEGQAKQSLDAALASVSKAGDGAAAVDAARQALTAFAGFTDAYQAGTKAYAPAKRATLTTAVAKARELSSQVSALAGGPKPWLFASSARKQAFKTLQDNAALAKTQAASLDQIAQAATSTTDLKALDADLARTAAAKRYLAALYASSSAAAAQQQAKQ